MTCNFNELRIALIAGWLAGFDLEPSDEEFPTAVASWLKASPDEVSNWIDSDWADEDGTIVF